MKIITYNILADQTQKSRLDGILNFIINENPDIVSFQEVAYGNYKIIISKLPNYNYVLDRRVEYNRLYGELLLVKNQIISSSYIPLDTPNMRGITVYTTQEYTVMTSHFEIDLKTKTMNAKYLTEMITNTQGNVIVLGDFNFFNNEPDLLTCLTAAESDATYKEYSSTPDRIYHRGYKTSSSRVEKLKLSDHYPLIVEIN